MKKLMVSALMTSTLMTGCSNIRSEVVLMPTLIATGIVSTIMPNQEKRDCAKFPKTKDIDVYNCNPQYNYAEAENKKDKTFALIDKDGNILIPYGEYGGFTELAPNYFRTIKKPAGNNYGGNNYGVVDKTGKVIVPFKYLHTIAYKEYFCGDTHDYESYQPEGKDCYDRNGNLVHGLGSK